MPRVDERAANSKLYRLPPEIRERLKYYVYLLTDPRTGDAFYVGKGTGDRLLSHGIAAEFLSPGRNEGAKLRRIREIREAGLEPRVEVVRHGLTEAEAFHVEGALIDVLPGLTNLVRGNDSLTNGRIPLLELITLFAAAPLETSTRALLIRLGWWHAGGVPGIPERRGGGFYPGMPRVDLYNATRGMWKVSPSRVRWLKIDYAVAVHRGVTRAVYRIDRDRWFQDPDRKRWGFEGHEITGGPEFDAFVGPFGRRLPTSKGAQNPISYYLPAQPGVVGADAVSPAR